MNRLAVALLLAACAPETGFEPIGAAVDPAADPGSPPQLRNLLLTVSPVIAGGVVTLSVSGASPGETVVFVWGQRGEGAGPCPAQVGGLCFDVKGGDWIGEALVGAGGVAELTVAAPVAAAAGSALTAQAAVVRGVGGASSVATDVVTVPIAATAVDVADYVPAEVDVLVVMDDSCSMFSYQNQLAAAFPVLLDELGALGVDFHIGVVTTDMDVATAGELRAANGVRWVSPTTPSLRPTLRQLVLAGTNGSAIEQGLAAMSAALDPTGPAAAVNSGFEREEAQLAVLVVTDEKDQSPDRPRDYSSLLVGRKAWSKTAVLHGLLGQGSCVYSGNNTFRYGVVVDDTRGLYDSICAADYAPLLLDIAATLYTSEPMYLSTTPPMTPIVHAHEPSGLTVALSRDQFDYDDDLNAVRTTSAYVPPAGTTFSIMY